MHEIYQLEASSLHKSRRVGAKAWNKAFLMVSSFNLFDVGYQSKYAQLVDQCSCVPSYQSSWKVCRKVKSLQNCTTYHNDIPISC